MRECIIYVEFSQSTVSPASTSLPRPVSSKIDRLGMLGLESFFGGIAEGTSPCSQGNQLPRPRPLRSCAFAKTCSVDASDVADSLETYPRRLAVEVVHRPECALPDSRPAAELLRDTHNLASQLRGQELAQTSPGLDIQQPFVKIGNDPEPRY